MEFHFDLKPRALYINLKSGHYVFPKDSAVGKTYVYKLLKVVIESGRTDLCVCTYKKNWTEQDYAALLTKQNYALIFLDRLDLYASKEIRNIIDNYSKDTIVLMDIKVLNHSIKEFPALASIELTEKIIKVVCYADSI